MSKISWKPFCFCVFVCSNLTVVVFLVAKYTINDFKYAGARNIPYRNVSLTTIPVRPTHAQLDRSENGEMLDQSQMLKDVQAVYNLSNPVLQSYIKEYESMFNEKLENMPDKGRLKGRTKASAVDVLCTTKSKAYMQFLGADTSPLKELGLGKYFQSEHFISGTPLYRKCAIVGSSISMRNSGLGSEIDSHDAVLRYNLAPVKNFEQDVGNKTTIRILNNQMLENSRYTELLRNCDDMSSDAKFVVWKATGGTYSGNLYQWVKRCRVFLMGYMNWAVSNPNKPMHVVNPVTLMRGWDVIQEFYNKPLPSHIPSSGFIGVLVMLPLCEEIDVYGYVKPDEKVHGTCHYFDEKCGPAPKSNWHPLDGERNLLSKMNNGGEDAVKRKGRVTLPGYSAIVCP